MTMQQNKPGRILAIDYGTKRLGLAVTDPYQAIAMPLIALAKPDLLPFLSTYVTKETVCSFVLGLPKDLNGQPTPMSRLVEQLGQCLQRTFPQITLYYHDERFTSKLAIQGLYQAGYAKHLRQKKANIDKISATIILQSFLNTIQNQSSSLPPL